MADDALTFSSRPSSIAASFQNRRVRRRPPARCAWQASAPPAGTHPGLFAVHKDQGRAIGLISGKNLVENARAD